MTPPEPLDGTPPFAPAAEEPPILPSAPAEPPPADNPPPGGPAAIEQGGQGPVYAWAPVEPAPRRRRLGLWIALAATAIVLIGGAVAAFIVWSSVRAEERLAEARLASSTEQSIVQDAVQASSDRSAGLAAATGQYRETAERWRLSEQAVAEWQEEATETPSVEAPNPGGPGLPGGDGAERALLDAIGASDVQLVYDAGPQNCGYSGGGVDAGFLAIGGCYNPTFRDSLFLAWDPGITQDQIWPIFVHEAMHWYQWDRNAVLFESASRAGIDAEQYRGFIESDASCRAVFEHGVPRWEFDASSSPCDVDGWHDAWLRDRLASLGVPVVAPDPETYEVEAVVRP